MTRTITMVGPFTDAQIAEMIAFLRRCDDANPTARFSLSIVDDEDATLERMERVLRDSLPERADRVTTIEVHRKQ